jgi:hypothetical protein
MKQLQKIVAKAKSLKKSYPNTKWTDLIKKASKLVTPAKKSVSGIKRTIVKKSAPAIPLIKKRIVSKSDFAMAGVKKKKISGNTRYVPVRHGEIKTKDINEFVSYCNDYYGKKGIFSKELNGGYTIAEIRKAVLKYIDQLESSQTWGYGDTLDRERVRDILVRSGIGKVSRKKAVKKSPARSYHKDTKSHNVRISVMSGIDVSSYLKELDAQIKNLNDWMEYVTEIKKLKYSNKDRDLRIATKKIIDLKDYIRDLKSIIVKNTRKK